MKFKKDYILFEKHEIPESLALSLIKQGKMTKTQEGGYQIYYSEIAKLDAYELNKMNLKTCPYRLSISSVGRLGASLFKIKYDFIDQRDKSFIIQEKINGYIRIKNEDFVLTDPYYTSIQLIDEVNDTGSEGFYKRSDLVSKLKDVIPEGSLKNDEILNYKIYKVEKFSLDMFPDCSIIPELNVSEDNNIPDYINRKFKENFKKASQVGKGEKIDNSIYIVYSDVIQKCFMHIKEVNCKSDGEKKAFFHNPQKILSKYLKEGREEQEEEQSSQASAQGDELSDDIIDNIFIETQQWKSNRILYLGEWIPKLGCYLPDRESPMTWIPKESIHLELMNDKGDAHFISVEPEDLPELKEEMQEAFEQKSTSIKFKEEEVPVNEQSISQVEKVADNFDKVRKNLSKKKEKITKLVPIIQDNINDLIFEKSKQKILNIPLDIPYEYIKTKKLYEYQKVGIAWIQESFIKRKPGLILADDMGLGKTLQVLVFLAWLKKWQIQKIEGLINKPFLIVAPKALLKNWEKEVSIHIQDDVFGKAYQAYGSNFSNDTSHSSINSFITKIKNQYSWAITTYETLRNKEEYFRNISWSTIIFDEAQKIKNPNSLLTDMAKAMDSDFSIAITGTPIENSLIDLWCISDCVHPKKFGTLKEFQKSCKDVSYIEQLRQEALHDKPPFMLKRLKEDVLKDKDFPQKKIKEIELQMSAKQADMYSNIIEKAKQKEFESPFQAIQYLAKISLYCSLDVSNEQLESDNVKIKELVRILEDIKQKNEKVLIFLRDRLLQGRLIQLLKDRFDIEASLINGKFSADKRQEIVSDFQQNSNQFDVLLVSPKAGGIGLTITAANHVIHLERWWNPAVEDQCTDRAYRIGQKKDVHVYLLLALHPEYGNISFDINLHKMLTEKRKIAKQIITNIDSHNFNTKNLYEQSTESDSLGYEEGSFYLKPEWKELRKIVFSKYPYHCMKCDSTKDLEVDHIKPRSKYPELELEIDNLQILCSTCNLEKGAKCDPINLDYRPTS